MRVLILAAAAAALLASPAGAGIPVTLKADTANANGIVTLSDLFDGAGAAGATPVAARPGASVVLDAAVVQAIARRAGLDWANAEGLHKIVVHGGASLGGTPGGAGAQRGNVDVLTYARSLAAGDIVQPTDLVWTKAAAAPADGPADADAIIGQAAKRPVRAGAIVQARDVGAAIVVKSGDLVTVAYDNDGVSLSMQGKALGQGGVGDVLSVQNPTSKKTIQAVITGPGQAVVGPAADQIKLSRPTVRYAAR
jgi:flagella basal body P-ring formation protein FlgA